MPQPNTRVVVLGTPKADKEFDLFDNDRAQAQRELERLGGDIEALEKKIRRDVSAARRDLRRGPR